MQVPVALKEPSTTPQTSRFQRACCRCGTILLHCPGERVDAGKVDSPRHLWREFEEPRDPKGRINGRSPDPVLPPKDRGVLDIEPGRQIPC